MLIKPIFLEQMRDIHLHRIKDGDERAPVVVIGDGHSVSFNPIGRVDFCDPLFIPPKTIRGYGKCTVWKVYFTMTCRGLEEASQQVSEFINRIPEETPVFLIGHSKSGCCFINAAKFLKRRCTLVSVSAPLRGTPIADFEGFGNRLNPLVHAIYRWIFSDHKVDKDICPQSEFIRQMDLSYAIQNHDFHIVASKCGFSWNPIDWVLWGVDKLLGINGDGIVPWDSQFPSGTPVPSDTRRPKSEGIKYHVCRRSHATSLSHSINHYIYKLDQYRK